MSLQKTLPFLWDSLMIPNQHLIKEFAIKNQNNCTSFLVPNPFSDEVSCLSLGSITLTMMLIIAIFEILRQARMKRISKDCNPLKNESKLTHVNHSNSSLPKNLKEDHKERIISTKSTSIRTSSLSLLKIVGFSGLLFCFPRPIQGSMDLLTFNPPTSSLESQFDSQVQLHNEISNRSTRMLEEIAQSSSMESSKPVSLALGRVLSSLSIKAYSIVLSKDKKTAFVSLKQPAAIKVLDVSNVESPTIITSLGLQPIYFEGGYALILSKDEKTLFVSNMRWLEIIDVSNFGAPVLLGEVEEPYFNKGGSLLHYLTSMALARDNKTLFVAGYGLQVIDISDLSQPKIISSSLEEVKGLPSETLLMEAKYCEKREILYLAGNKTLNISDARNPRDLKPLGLYSSPSYSIQSVFISKKNYKEVFVFGRDEKKNQMILKKIDVTNPSMNLGVIESYNLDYDSSSLSSILGSSSDENVLFIQSATLFGIFNIAKNLLKLEEFDQNIQKFKSGVTSIVIAEDDSTILMASSTRDFQILELYKNYPNSRIFKLAQNVIGSLNSSADIAIRSLYLTSDEKVLFIQRGYSYNQDPAFAVDIVNISDTRNPELISSFSFTQDTFKLAEIKIFEKMKRAYLFGPDGIAMVDISDLKKLSFVGKIKQTSIGRIDSVEYSSDWSKGYILVSKRDVRKQKLIITDLSDEENQEMKVLGEIDVASITSMSFLTKKEDLMFLAGQRLEIYNVSELQNPRRISFSALDPDRGNAIAESMMLSDNEKILFAHILVDLKARLAIYDVG